VKRIFILQCLAGSTFWIVASCLAEAPAGTAQRVERPEQGPEPRAVFEATNFNFGRIKAGEIVRHDFVFTNRGEPLLEIMEVKPGCGCTTAGDWDKGVKPGGTGRISVQFNSGACEGLVSKSAVLTCNDPRQSNVVLQLSGTVWKPISITPATAFFQPTEETQVKETRILRIVSNLEGPVTLSDLECSDRSFEVEFKSIKPGREFELLVSSTPPFASRRASSAVITMKTSSSEAPLIEARAYSMVQPVLAIIPQQIILPPSPLAGSVTSLVTVRNNGTNLLALSDARMDAPGVKVEVRESESGRQFTLAVKFPPGFKVAPGREAVVTAKSDHPRFPVIKVPVSHLEPPATVVR